MALVSSTGAAERLTFFRFSAFEATVHGISTRVGGVSAEPYDSLNLGYATSDALENVQQNRALFAAALGIPLQRMAAARLTHGTMVSVFDSHACGAQFPGMAPIRTNSPDREPAFFSDAAISNIEDLYLFMTFADCVPLLFLDGERGVVGAAHAGWRGTAAGIAGEVVRAMREHFDSDPRDIRVGIGPSIGPCCFEVGEDVPAAFCAAGFTPVVNPMESRIHLDLWATNQIQLTAEGILAENMEISGICTACNTHAYFSHRAEHGRTGRFALCIGLPPRSE